MVVEAASHFPEHDSDAVAFSAPHSSLQPALPHPSRGPGAPRPPPDSTWGLQGGGAGKSLPGPPPQARGRGRAACPPNLG